MRCEARHAPLAAETSSTCARTYRPNDMPCLIPAAARRSRSGHPWTDLAQHLGIRDTLRIIYARWPLIVSVVAAGLLSALLLQLEGHYGLRRESHPADRRRSERPRFDRADARAARLDA